MVANSRIVEPLDQKEKWSKEDCEDLLEDIQNRRTVMASLSVPTIRAPKTFEERQIDDLRIGIDIYKGLALGVASKLDGDGLISAGADIGAFGSTTLGNTLLLHQLNNGDFQSALETNYNTNLIGAGGYVFGNLSAQAATTGEFLAFGSRMTFSQGFRAVATKANPVLLWGSVAIFAAEKGSLGFLNARDYFRGHEAQEGLQDSFNVTTDSLNTKIRLYNTNCRGNK